MQAPEDVAVSACGLRKRCAPGATLRLPDQEAIRNRPRDMLMSWAKVITNPVTLLAA